ncbi:uncharacterized protein [Chironomus tepperi]|uniref:uncharacterized protein n=1 Tax=Chironomus tepperi TaxID=113505 RepID=UPI00391F97BC
MKLIIGIILLQSVVLIYGQGLDGFCAGRPTGAYPHPDPDRCDLFVVCAVGLPILQECGNGTIFLPWLGSDPPYGECVPGYPETCQLATEPTTLGTTTTSTYAPPTNETTTAYPEIPRDICDGILFRRIPHPNNCYQYYFCIAQVPHLGECERHQIFHPDWNICIRGNRNECRFCLFC